MRAYFTDVRNLVCCPTSPQSLYSHVVWPVSIGTSLVRRPNLDAQVNQCMDTWSTLCNYVLSVSYHYQVRLVLLIPQDISRLGPTGLWLHCLPFYMRMPFCKTWTSCHFCCQVFTSAVSTHRAYITTWLVSLFCQDWSKIKTRIMTFDLAGGKKGHYDLFAPTDYS